MTRRAKEKDVPRPKIVSVRFKLETDQYYPFEDMIGGFSNKAESEFAVNHRRRQGQRGDLEWFNPACVDNRADAERAYFEMMPFVHEQKWMMRITALAKVDVPCGTGEVTGTVGPFGYDGFDNEDQYGRLEAEKEVKRELTEKLLTLGFKNQEISAALENAETEDG
jgi:hypothetical protein